MCRSGFVEAIAARTGFPVERLILGGDHLGPNPWRHLPPDAAMAKARGLVAAFAAAGFRAAVCEQVEDPKEAKGLVKREITRFVTPGTLTDEALLDERRDNLLLALHQTKHVYGLAHLDLSGGRFTIMQVQGATALLNELALLESESVLSLEAASERVTILAVPLENFQRLVGQENGIGIPFTRHLLAELDKYQKRWLMS